MSGRKLSPVQQALHGRIYLDLSDKAQRNWKSVGDGVGMDDRGVISEGSMICAHYQWSTEPQRALDYPVPDIQIDQGITKEDELKIDPRAFEEELWLADAQKQ